VTANKRSAPALWKLETGLNDLIFHKSQLLVTARISMSPLTP